MAGKVVGQISEAISESKKQIQTLTRKGAELAEKGLEAAGKARNKAEETAAMGASAISVISEKVQKENLIRMAETVREEIRTTLLAETLSDIAKVQDDADELRRKMNDMQKIYDRKIAELHAEIKSLKTTAEKPAEKTAPKPRAPKKPAAKAE